MSSQTSPETLAQDGSLWLRKLSTYVALIKPGDFMTILLLTISFTIDDAFSLKDKRKVVKSIIHKAQDRFKVSSAEVNYQEIHNLSEVAFVMVSGQYSVAKEHMDKLFAFIENSYPIQITHYEFSEL